MQTRLLWNKCRRSRSRQEECCLLYTSLADFGDAVLVGQLGVKGAKFVTWEWDFDRQGVHAGHYFMENYEAAKQDFAVRAGLVERQRLFSDEQIAVIKNACEFALEDLSLIHICWWRQ